MSACDPGEEFWGNLARQQEFLDPDAEDAWAHENEEFDDEGDDSSASRITDLQADGSFGLSLPPQQQRWLIMTPMMMLLLMRQR